MKKIKARFNQKDRVVCVPAQGGHEFYYQPVGSQECILLFGTNALSYSVCEYFRTRGRCMKNAKGPSLTIKELYDFKSFYNVKLTNQINRIPTMIDYVLHERMTQEKRHTAAKKKARYRAERYDNLEFAA